MAEVELRQRWQLDLESVQALASALHPNPFGVLGPHGSPDGRVIRAFIPGAREVEVLRRTGAHETAMLEQEISQELTLEAAA